MVERRTVIAVASVVAGLAVAWRPALTLASGSVEFVGVGAAVPAFATLVGATLVVGGLRLLGSD